MRHAKWVKGKEWVKELLRERKVERKCKRFLQGYLRLVTEGHWWQPRTQQGNRAPPNLETERPHGGHCQICTMASIQECAQPEETQRAMENRSWGDKDCNFAVHPAPPTPVPPGVTSGRLLDAAAVLWVPGDQTGDQEAQVEGSSIWGPPSWVAIWVSCISHYLCRFRLPWLQLFNRWQDLPGRQLQITFAKCAFGKSLWQWFSWRTKNWNWHFYILSDPWDSLTIWLAMPLKKKNLGSFIYDMTSATHPSHRRVGLLLVRVDVFWDFWRRWEVCWCISQALETRHYPLIWTGNMSDLQSRWLTLWCVVTFTSSNLTWKITGHFFNMFTCRWSQIYWWGR